MRSTMQDIPLSVARILEYARTVHSDTTVSTYSEGKLHTSTYRTIAARASALAHALREELGIDGDQRVGTFMYNCAEHLETLCAVTCMGAVFNPLNRYLMNDQIRHIVNHANDEVIIADPRLAEQLGEVLEDCECVRAVVFIGTKPLSQPSSFLPDHIAVYSYEELLDGRPTRYSWPVLPETTAAAICYSTGTEGAPKGVVYSHRSLYLQSMHLRTTDSLAISHGDTFLCCVPIYHVLSWGVPFAALMSGAPLVLPDSDVSPATLTTLIELTHPRVAHGAPTLWIQLMVYYLEHPPKRMSLTEIFVGGSPAPPALIRMWEEHYGVDVVQVWGMTETSTATTVARPPRGVSGAARTDYRISQGRFPASVEYRVVNDGEIVSSTDRNHGELQVRGNFVTGTYYHSPAEEAEGAAHMFRGEAVDDALDKFTDDGWLRTGDVGTVTSDGFLIVQDRARDVIRSGGEWIYSAVLENFIMESHEVVECAVIGYPDEKWGERPLAVTVLHDGVEPNATTAERLREELRSHLPSWMLPEYWTFVKSIDKTSVAKFDKKDLRAHLKAGRFDVIALRGPGARERETFSAHGGGTQARRPL